MKMAKKFLAVALAGVLALSVLTGCGASVKSKDIADSLTKMGVKVEQSKDVDKTAEKTLKAIEARVNAPANAAKADTDTSKITLDNAIKMDGGKVFSKTTITDNTTNDFMKALGMHFSGSDAENANYYKQIRVALVKTENATKDASLQAARVEKAMLTMHPAFVKGTIEPVEPGKLGSAKTSDGKYILVVIVNDVVEKKANG